MSRGWNALLALGAVAVTAALLRRLARRSGATTEEFRGRLPGDEIVARPLWTSTRAITIDAAPSAVWPWVVQMGYPTFRAGWYTPHWLDELMWGERPRSADTIVPELQDLKVGDKVPDSADFRMYYTVDEIVADRHLVLHSTRHVVPPLRCVDFSWVFVLLPVDGDRTRLLVRARVAYEPVWPYPLVEAVVGLGDFVNVTVMLRGIRGRAERSLIRA
jgi:hypothetical protein